MPSPERDASAPGDAAPAAAPAAEDRAPGAARAGRDGVSAAAPAARDEGSGSTEPARARGYARMRAAEDAARAELKPLAPGERPLAIKVAAALAAAIGVGNLSLLAGGWQMTEGPQPGLLQSLALPVFMLVCAVAMWQRRYWALVAFQAILGVSIIFAFLFLLRASNLEAVLLCVGVLAICGALFWFLVRAMARVQMPGDPSR